MNKNWSNTALVAYSHLPKIVKQIDFGVESRIKSSFQSRHLKAGVSNEQLIGEILELNEEKRKIVNLRYIVTIALKSMKESDMRILIDRIVYRKTFQSIAQENGFSLRTAFRRVANAEEEYAKYLRRCGYTESWFEKEYGQDKYISRIYKRIRNDKYYIAKSL